MKTNSNYEICRLCGKYKKLSFEHVPPHSAFNSNPVKIYKGDQIFTNSREHVMPWELQDLRYKNYQNGKGGYYLCSECNNNTGSWYGQEYSRVINSIGIELIAAIKEGKNSKPTSIQFETEEKIYPSRIFKQIMTMFCDINEELHKDINLQRYLLDPDFYDFDNEKYKVYMYLSYEGMERLMPFFWVFRKAMKPIRISEIVSFPVGLSLYLDLHDDENIPGTNINCFSEIGFNEVRHVQMSLPLLDNYTGIPLDFRTKEQVKEDVAKQTANNKESINTITHF